MTVSILGLTLIRTRTLEQLRATSATPAGLVPPVPPVAADADSQLTTVSRELVDFADRLGDLTGTGTPADAGQAAAALRWLRSRVQELLTACGVDSIDDAGAIDLARHEIVASRPAPDSQSAGHIAETVRLGYSRNGSLLRPQQVVSYRSTDKE